MEMHLSDYYTSPMPKNLNFHPVLHKTKSSIKSNNKSKRKSKKAKKTIDTLFKDLV